MEKGATSLTGWQQEVVRAAYGLEAAEALWIAHSLLARRAAHYAGSNTHEGASSKT